MTNAIGLIVMIVALTGLAAEQTLEYRFSYYANGRICVDPLSGLDGKVPINVPETDHGLVRRDTDARHQALLQQSAIVDPLVAACARRLGRH